LADRVNLCERQPGALARRFCPFKRNRHMMRQIMS
jgi:hypothetical protein